LVAGAGQVTRNPPRIPTLHDVPLQDTYLHFFYSSAIRSKQQSTIAPGKRAI
jgi:hypothetical protein